ncbi:hypothetical protein GEU84_005360 [Fertoebacter nigrum]|uniref:Uncharacterized protein n=1 Tax=Fertoeibacter niger TaxID=2656921 RepID=A0A8X8KMD4_9RHOB|nr:hypothetical protein [Fertoeibacter niger]NUB43805.1 hypothetical protein [Fertoeibacter niger]
MIRLESEYSQTGGLPKEDTAIIRVLTRRDSRIEVLGRHIGVSLDLFSNTEILEEPLLLVENAQSDGWFYSFLFSSISAKRGRGLCRVEPRHGGGDDIVGVLETCIARKRVVVTLVDSDRLTPISVGNNKMKLVRKANRRSGWPLSVCDTPPCHEMENLVPFPVVLSMQCALNNSANPVLSAICSHEEDSKSFRNRFWHFFDVKNGVVSEKVHKLTADEISWLNEKLNISGISISPDFTDNKYIPGYGSRVVDQLKADPDLQELFQKHVHDIDWRTAFDDFAEGVLPYFMGATKRIT